jgi:hypothetical protein
LQASAVHVPGVVGEHCVHFVRAAHELNHALSGIRESCGGEGEQVSALLVLGIVHVLVNTGKLGGPM